MNKQNKNKIDRNRDQIDGCHRGGGKVKKVKGNMVNTIVITLHGDT